MPTEDRFDPADPLPRFLAEQEEQDFGNYRDEGAVLSRLFKASLLVAAVAVTGLAVLALGNPLALFSDATASLVGNSSPKPATDQPAPVIQSAENAPALAQSTADPQPLPPTATAAPAREENTAAGPVSKDQAEPSDAASEALFRRFQTWLSDQDTQAKAEPVQPAIAAPAPIMQEYPAQDAPAQAAENARCTASALAKAPSRSGRPQRTSRPACTKCPETTGPAGASCTRGTPARTSPTGCASTGAAGTTTGPGAVVPANLRPAQLTSRARLRPDRDRLLQPPDHLRGLRHERPKGCITRCRVRLSRV